MLWNEFNLKEWFDSTNERVKFDEKYFSDSRNRMHLDVYRWRSTH